MESSQPYPGFQRALFGMAALTLLVDLVWWRLSHFQLDVPAYGRLILISLGMFAAGGFYHGYRREPALAVMLTGAGFLCLFSVAASVLNYFLITVAGTRIDGALVAADRALGFDWYSTMLWMSRHAWLNTIFFYIYNLVLPEIALLLVALAWSGHVEKAYRYCLAIGTGALIAIAVWTVMPSTGAKSLYTLPADVASRLTLSVTCQYGHDLIALLKNGPGYITPDDMRGLIAFPSYHGVLALIVAFYGWSIPRLRWPLVLINAVVIVASPVQGGHHMIDLVAAFPVAAVSIWMAHAWPAKSRSVVNKTPKFTIRPVPQGVFCIMPEQDSQPSPCAIKAKLSDAI